MDGQLSQEVIDRLERELGVINKLGFSNYFLIVWDFVRFAREQGIQATARGSGVGSLVAYALHLSHVCPLEYDLLFERFLDESRREAPDIDIDFCQQRRGEVIQYVKESMAWPTWPRSARSARWRPGRRSATWVGPWGCPSRGSMPWWPWCPRNSTSRSQRRCRKART